MIEKALEFITNNPEVLAPVGALALRMLPNVITDAIIAVIKFIITNNYNKK